MRRPAATAPWGDRDEGTARKGGWAMVVETLARRSAIGAGSGRESAGRPASDRPGLAPRPNRSPRGPPDLPSGAVKAFTEVEVSPNGREGIRSLPRRWGRRTAGHGPRDWSTGVRRRKPRREPRVAGRRNGPVSCASRTAPTSAAWPRAEPCRGPICCARSPRVGLAVRPGRRTIPPEGSEAGRRAIRVSSRRVPGAGSDSAGRAAENWVRR